VIILGVSLGSMVHEKNPHSDGLAVFDDMSCWIPCDFVLGYNLYLPAGVVSFSFQFLLP
jgi:hypothetical protein